MKESKKSFKKVKEKVKGLTANIILYVIAGILLIIFVCSIIEVAAPSLAFSLWFRNIFDAITLVEKIKARDQEIIRGIILCAAVYALSIASRLIINKVITKKSNRAKTIGNIVSGFIKYGCAIAIFFLLLGVLGVNTTTLWASAGILTLVIGLGCQSLIADVIAGVFIIFEREYDIGEIIVVDGFRGTVKDIGIRTTKIVDAAGDIKIINNSDIKTVVNLSRELSVAVCECGIEYKESIEKVEAILAKNLYKMKEHIPEIVDGPFYLGVSELSSSSVIIKLIAKCKEEDKYQVQRALNKELKLIFDENNINIPFPQITLNQPSILAKDPSLEEKEDKKP